MTEHTVWFSPTDHEPRVDRDFDLTSQPDRVEGVGLAGAPDHVWRHSSALAAARVLNARAAGRAAG